jgi:hypothetical protein
MEKGLAFLSVALTVGVVALSAAACESESPSNFNENEKDATAGDTGPGFNVDGNTTGQDQKSPVTCNPALPTDFKPAWKPPTKASVCSNEKLAEYYEACLGNVGVPDAGGICSSWKEANAECGGCIEAADNSGPIQWHRDRSYFTLNIAGCLSLERNEPEEGKCPATYHASVQCQRDSCSGCLLQSNAQFQDFQKCQADAKSAGGCKSYNDQIVPVCGTTFNDPDGGAYACFRPSGENEKTHFVRVEGIFCGP